MILILCGGKKYTAILRNMRRAKRADKRRLILFIHFENIPSKSVIAQHVKLFL